MGKKRRRERDSGGQKLSGLETLETPPCRIALNNRVLELMRTERKRTKTGTVNHVSKKKIRRGEPRGRA